MLRSKNNRNFGASLSQDLSLEPKWHENGRCGKERTGSLSRSLPAGTEGRARGAPEPQGGSGERWRPTVDRKIKPYECFNGNYFIDRPTGRAHFFHRDRMALGVSVTIRTYIESLFKMFDRTFPPGYARAVRERNMNLFYGSLRRATPG